MTTSLSGSAIIVIVVVVAGLLVTILWVFSGHYGQTATMQSGTTPITHDQETYMRQVRQRTYENAFAQSIIMGAGADGATTTRTSQVWSNANAAATTTTTTPNTPADVAGGPRRSNSYGMPAQTVNQNNANVNVNVNAAVYQQQHQQLEKDGSRVNYSSYDDGYYEQQSPYDGGYVYGEYGYGYGYEQEQQEPQAQ